MHLLSRYAMYACTLEIGHRFFAGACALSDRLRISADPPHRFANRVLPAPAPTKANGAHDLQPAPFARSGIYKALAHEFIDVLVEAVVYGVDLTYPTVPACPLPVFDPPLGERRHLDTIGEKAVSDVEVLDLYPMLARRHAIDDVSCSLTGVREASSSILHSRCATLVVSISFSLMSRAPGCYQHRRGNPLIRHPYYTISYGNYLLIVVIFWEERSAKYRAWRSTWNGLRN